MHLVFREQRGLEQGEEAIDLGQSPSDLVFLSFSDSDLGAVAAAWERNAAALPPMRLANLARLAHPMSVDIHVERVIAQARCIVVRLLGGVDYWSYGVEQVASVCRAEGIPLALVPGDAREDTRLGDLSTVPAEVLARMDALLAAGGPANTRRALDLMAALARGEPAPDVPVEEVPLAADYGLGLDTRPDAPLALVVFYRSHLLAGDTAPVDALATALHRRGFAVEALAVASLKEPTCTALVRQRLAERRPSVVVNATGFSARLDDGAGSPLDAADAPVLQVALAGSTRAAWEESTRGLSQSDLAMQVVLPELDGRVFADAVSFKEDGVEIEGLQYSRTRHVADADLVEGVAARAAGWARLAHTLREDRHLAIVLSDYPGAAGQAAHAVGLDAPASLARILDLLADAGYRVDRADVEALVGALCRGPMHTFLSLDEYTRLYATLPEEARAAIEDAWGLPQDDPSVSDGGFHLRWARLGNAVTALQPDRGNTLDRKADYHDPDLPPRHAYVAFHLWLREIERIHAIVHLGTHGTLEWLPGKAVAQSPACFPRLLAGGLPVVYPFIVNNPGEAATAKRRIGAVTVGHLTPPLKSAGSHGAAVELEKLIDEYAAADGLDQRRMVLLRREILERAGAAGLLEESGVTRDMSEDEALSRLDAYLCDVKDMQIRDGLHVFGASPPADRRTALLEALARSMPGQDADDLADRLDASPAAERTALIAGLDGRFVEPGPAGAPTRGRADVLPTGRNLFTVDPRAVPTRSALALAEKNAESLLARHVQDHGEWPARLVIDLWGSATIRTGGEDLALALVLMGVRPTWDEGSSRVNGFEVLPSEELGRPRIDVTLRISGLFRDAFQTQIDLFDAAVRAVARRSEEGAANPLAREAAGLEGDALRHATARIFGAAPGRHGAGINALLDRGAWESTDELGRAYLDASSAAYGRGLEGRADADGFARRVASADAFVHQQDHREIDLFEGGEFVAHEGGFAAASRALGGTAALYHIDAATPGEARVRTLTEEVVRVARGRAANPAWIAGMRRHGYRGAAEVARALDSLFGFAATLPVRLDRQFDIVFDATVGDEEVDRFLREANPEAHAAMLARFAEAIRRGLWQPRRNAVAAALAEAEA